MEFNDYVFLAACCGVVAWYLLSASKLMRSLMRGYLIILRSQHPLAYAELKKRGLPHSAWLHLATLAEHRLRDRHFSRFAWKIRAITLSVPVIAVLLLALAWTTLEVG